MCLNKQTLYDVYSRSTFIFWWHKLNNLQAFRDGIAYAEGTDKPGQPTKNKGYDVIVGGKLFSDYSKHPGVYVKLPKHGITSSAAGRYQILEKWAKAYIKQLNLPDFGPDSQDAICNQLIRECGAMSDVLAGRFEQAYRKCSARWASLPGSTAGQRVEDMKKILEVCYESLAKK